MRYSWLIILLFFPVYNLMMTKVHIVKAMVFPVIMYRRESWTIKKAAAAKSLQSCPTPSNPMDCSLAGSSVHGVFQARVLEWGAIAFSERRLSTEELMFSNCGGGKDF